MPGVETDRIRMRPLVAKLQVVEFFDDLQETRVGSAVVEGEKLGDRLDHTRETTPDC